MYRSVSVLPTSQYYVPEKQSVHVYYMLFCTRNYDGFPTPVSSWWKYVSTSYSYTGLFVFKHLWTGHEILKQWLKSPGILKYLGLPESVSIQKRA